MCRIKVSKTLMLLMRTKVTHVHYQLPKKICQIDIFFKQSYEATRLNTFIILLEERCVGSDLGHRLSSLEEF
jgi:hypothetical protein